MTSLTIWGDIIPSITIHTDQGKGSTTADTSAGLVVSASATVFTGTAPPEGSRMPCRGPLEYIPWVSKARVSFDSAILDIGCGSGNLLLKIHQGGYNNLTGTDPFIQHDITYHGTIRIYRNGIDAFTSNNGKYDLIMMHHSLEHMPDQKQAIMAASDLLAPGGKLLIRIPLADSYAWEHYRENWIQLDAPRHLFLHSKTGLALLAEFAGLRITDIDYDSSRFQFTGSELYRRNIPLSADSNTGIFSARGNWTTLPVLPAS